jgi:hypothetical protein
MLKFGLMQDFRNLRQRRRPYSTGTGDMTLVAQRSLRKSVDGRSGNSWGAASLPAIAAEASRHSSAGCPQSWAWRLSDKSNRNRNFPMAPHPPNVALSAASPLGERHLIAECGAAGIFL